MLTNIFKYPANVLSTVIRTIALAAVVIVSGCTMQKSLAPQIVDQSLTDIYRTDISILAADEFMGRRPGTEGGQKTIDFLVRRFKEIGLEPGNGDSYLQPVDLRSQLVTLENDLQVSGPAGEMTLANWDDIGIRAVTLVEELDLNGKEVVFVGYGATAPEFDWDDYAGIDVTGKVVVMLRNDPGGASGDETIFAGSKGTTHGHRTTKFKNAFKHGALAAMAIYDPALSTSTYGWDRIRKYFKRGDIGLATSFGEDSSASMSAYLEINAGRRLLGLAGHDYDSLMVAAYTRGFKSFTLPITFKGRVIVTRNDFTSYNVLGLLPGSDRPDEVMIYTAHWDHLGMDTTLAGDQIFNGAADNATGTAAIINLATAFKALGTQPRRSVLFMGLTAEEMGLLGSKYYAKHPTFPKNMIIAELNIDMLPYYGPTNDVIIFGLGKSNLDGYVKRAAKKMGLTVRGDLWPEENIYYRSDHINFARVGIPSLYLSIGVEHQQFGEEWGMQQVKKFMKNHYHKVSDEYSDSWDLTGIMNHIQLTFDIGYSLANSTDYPNWNKKDDFRPIRDASMAELKGE